VGQAYIGQHLENAPWVFASSMTTLAGIAAGGSTPKITALAPGAGTGASITSQVGYDQAGSFILTAGTGPTGGSAISVAFGTPLGAAPSSVQVTAGNSSAGGVASITVGAISATKSGFTIFASAGTLSAAYVISYQVIR
jgi:hypothetical protein